MLGGDCALRPPRTVADLEELLDSSTDQISVWDPQLRLIFANAAMLDWLERDISQLRGVGFGAVVGNDVSEHVAPFFDAARRGRPVKYRRVLDGPDGAQRTMSTRVSARLRAGSDSTAVDGFVTVSTDLTAQVRARSDQRDNAARAILARERARVAAELQIAVLDPLAQLLVDLRTPAAQPELARVVIAGVARLQDTITEIRRVIRGLRDTPPSEPSMPVVSVPQRVPVRAVQAWDPGLSSASGDAGASAQWTLDEALAFVDELPGLTAWDVDQVNCFANRAAVQGVGEGHRAAMIGRTRLELFGPEVTARSQPFAEAAASGTLQRFDSEFVDGAGVHRVVHFVYYPVIRAGRPIGMVATLNDLDDSDDDVPSLVPRETLADERLRIAEDLHDNVIQQLYAAGLTLDAADDASRTQRVEQALQCVTYAIESLQVSLHALHEHATRPVADLITETVTRSATALGFVPRLDLIGDLRRITPAMTGELLAVLTETLSNVARHARAEQVSVTLSTSDHSAWLRVADDGVGISQLTRSSGLSNLRNRAARLDGDFAFRPNVPRGTVVDWRVPI